LTVDPAYGMIPPGESVSLELKVTVDDAVARDISLGRELAFPSLTAPQTISGPIGGAGAVGGGVSVSSAAVGGLLEDILVLRMERGRDYYISVSANVLPTCFGCSLAQLARRPEPMRALSLTAAATTALNSAAGVSLGASASGSGMVSPPAGGAAPTGAGAGVRPIAAPPDLSAGSHSLATLLSGDDADLAPTVFASGGSLDFEGPGGRARTGSAGVGGAPLSSSDLSRKGSQLMSVPKEVWRLVDALWTRGMETRGLFLAPGNAADAIEIREALDTGDAIPPSADPLAIAQVLCDLLESLREPVIPVPFFPGADFKAVPVEAWAGQLMRQLTALHYNVLVYLLRFGREVLAHAHANGTTVEDLAYVLSRCMMRRVTHDEAAAHAPLDPAAAAAAAATGGASADGGGSSGFAGLFGGRGGGSGSSGGAGGSGGDEEEGAALARLSLFADKGTRWEPTREEQESMSRIFVYLLTLAPLA
jgi:hypothetical protein